MSPVATPPESKKKFLIISLLAHVGLIAVAVIVSQLTFSPEVKPLEVSFVSEEQLESMIAQAQVVQAAQVEPTSEPLTADVEPEVTEAVDEPFFESLRPLFSDTAQQVEPPMDQQPEAVTKTKPLIEPSTDQDLSEWALKQQQINDELQQKKQRDERLRDQQRDQQQQNLKAEQQAQRDKQRLEREQEKKELERLKAEQSKPQPAKKAVDKPAISAEDFMGEVNNELSKQPPARNSSDDKSTADSFYARMKQKIEGNWNDASPQSFVIPVTINLSRSGAVIRARVQKSTGNAEIDQRLEKAIYDSSPLPISDDPYLYNKFFKQFTVNFETR